MFNEENTVEQMVLDTLCGGVTSNMVAEELASYRGNQSAASLEGASLLTKIDGSLLVSLLADITRGMQDKVKILELVVEPTMLTLPWSASGGEVERGVIDAGIARTALSAFSRSAFIDSSSARQSFDIATRLLLGLDAPVLFVKMLGEEALSVFDAGARSARKAGVSRLIRPSLPSR